MAELKEKSESFGGCNADRVVPDRAQLSPTTKVISFTFTFEEALKLSLSLSEGTRWLNSLDRSTKEGRCATLVLCVKPKDGRAYVLKGRMPEKSQRLTRPNRNL